MIQLSNGDWVAPEKVAVIFRDGEEVTLCSDTGANYCTDTFDDDDEARKFMKDSAQRINAALQLPADGIVPPPAINHLTPPPAAPVLPAVDHLKIK